MDLCQIFTTWKICLQVNNSRKKNGLNGLVYLRWYVLLYFVIIAKKLTENSEQHTINILYMDKEYLRNFCFADTDILFSTFNMF